MTSISAGIKTLKFSLETPKAKSSGRALQRCAVTRLNAALSPWRQVRILLRPDEQPCRQGTLLARQLAQRFQRRSRRRQGRNRVSTETCYNTVGAFKKNAHRQPTFGHSDHHCAACPRDTMDFSTRTHGSVHVFARDLPVRLPSPLFWQLLQRRAVRARISRSLLGRSSQHTALRPHRTPLVESSGSLDFGRHYHGSRTVGIARSNS